jgi:transcriptional regulator with XRE-family HTH domain
MVGTGFDMPGRFAHSERHVNANVRCPRDDSADRISHSADMDTDGGTFGAKLRAARKEKGWSLDRLAAEADTGKSYLSELERGVRPMPPGRKLDAIAAALGTTASRLAGPAPIAGATAQLPQMAPMRRVPVIGDVQAGAWSMAFEDDDPSEFLSVDLPAFARARLFGLRVVGRSMDQEYPEGTRVVICPAAEIGVREGDHVIVRRRRGSGVETTIKEVVIEDGAVVLWPRSSDPAYQEPIRLETVRDADEGPEIIGVVVAAYKVRMFQPGPLVILP